MSEIDKTTPTPRRDAVADARARWASRTPIVIVVEAITYAPIKPGESFGPCLLNPFDKDHEWTIGSWDGEAWYSDEGFRFKRAKLFALLPALTERSATA